jgi:hypothetical protein
VDVKAILEPAVLEPYVLAVGAVIGAFLKAKWTSGQETWGRETLQDCFFALVLGILWPYDVAVPETVPYIGGMAWPPFRLPMAMPLPVKGVLMAALSALFIGVIKKGLMRFPDLFERLTGTKLPGGNNALAPGGSDAPKP